MIPSSFLRPSVFSPFSLQSSYILGSVNFGPPIRQGRDLTPGTVPIRQVEVGEDRPLLGPRLDDGPSPGVEYDGAAAEIGPRAVAADVVDLVLDRPSPAEGLPDVSSRRRELGDGDEKVCAGEGELPRHLREPEVVADLKADGAPGGLNRRYQLPAVKVDLLGPEGVDLILKADPRLVEAEAPVQTPVDYGPDDQAAVLFDKGPEGAEGGVGGVVRQVLGVAEAGEEELREDEDLSAPLDGFGGHGQGPGQVLPWFAEADRKLKAGRDHDQKKTPVYIKMTYKGGMVQRLKRRAYEILEATDPEDALGRRTNFFIMALILLNVAAVVLESEASIDARYGHLFDAFGLFSIVAFTAEYALRLWVSDLCPVTGPGRFGPVGGRVRFALSPLAIIDLAVILPYYLPIVFPDLRFLRGVRVFWLFRLLEVGRYSESMGTLERVIRAKKEELTVTFFAIVFFLTVASSIIYFLEHDVQPDSFPSIPATMWWGLLTLTTIGYGDVYPVTTLGKIAGSLIIILGVGMFALPTGILASGFVEDIQSRAKLRAERAIDAASGTVGEQRPARSQEERPRRT